MHGRKTRDEQKNLISTTYMLIQMKYRFICSNQIGTQRLKSMIYCLLQ